MRMKDKVALISGASSGMGAATARLFAREGAKAVIVADLLDKEGEAVVAEIKKAGGKASYIHLDVTDETQWKAAVDKTVADHGSLDVLVNNAGISGSAEQDLYDTAAWNRLMGINATGVFLGMKHAIAAMKKAGTRGSVINLSSVSGIVGQGNIHVGYNASKGAVRLITKAAAAQHGRDGIRINSVHPGLMPPMRTSGRTADPATRAKTLKGVPLGRAGEVDEVAFAILFLASDESSYVTGAELVADGGWTAASWPVRKNLPLRSSRGRCSSRNTPTATAGWRCAATRCACPTARSCRPTTPSSSPNGCVPWRSPQRARSC